MEMCRPWAAQGLKESGVYFINYVWLCQLLVAVCGLSLVRQVVATLQRWCMGFSSWWLLLLESVGFRVRELRSCGTWA